MLLWYGSGIGSNPVLSSQDYNMTKRERIYLNKERKKRWFKRMSKTQIDPSYYGYINGDYLVGGIDPISLDTDVQVLRVSNDLYEDVRRPLIPGHLYIMDVAHLNWKKYFEK